MLFSQEDIFYLCIKTQNHITWFTTRKNNLFWGSMRVVHNEIFAGKMKELNFNFQLSSLQASGSSSPKREVSSEEEEDFSDEDERPLLQCTRVDPREEEEDGRYVRLEQEHFIFQGGGSINWLEVRDQWIFWAKKKRPENWF